MPYGKLDVRPGWVLLTCNVGGEHNSIRDMLLTTGIKGFQKIKEHDGVANYTHSELLTNAIGQTFAARWRTRLRDNGLQDYVGSNIMVIEPLGMTMKLFRSMWQSSDMCRFDGDIYPFWRLLLQAVSAFGPSFLAKWGFGSHAVCSEVVAKFFSGTPPWNQYFNKWRGHTPAMIENWGRIGRDFRIVYEGLLEEKDMRDAGLPLYRLVISNDEKTA